MQKKLKLRVINERHWFIRGLIKGSPVQVIHKRFPHLTPLAHFHTVHFPSLAAFQHHNQTQPRKGNTCTSSELAFRRFQNLNRKKTTLQNSWLIFRRPFHMYMRHTGLSNAHTFFHVQDSHTLITFHHMGKLLAEQFHFTPFFSYLSSCLSAITPQKRVHVQTQRFKVATQPFPFPGAATFQPVSNVAATATC